MTPAFTPSFPVGSWVAFSFINSPRLYGPVRAIDITRRLRLISHPDGDVWLSTWRLSYDLIHVLTTLGACAESRAWLEQRRREDPGASFAKRWAEAGAITAAEMEAMGARGLATADGGSAWLRWLTWKTSFHAPHGSFQSDVAALYERKLAGASR